MSNRSRVKRQFAGAASDPAQRQITNFYSRSTIAKTTSTNTSSNSSTTTVAPPLPPAHIQANLLNVGMRVRKSVPDGYKTGTHSSFSLWTDTDGAGRSKSQQASRPTPTRPSVTTAPTTKTTTRELQPFCGILKTGGLGVQDLGLDNVPGLCSSQDSLASEDSLSSVPEPTLSSWRGPPAGPSGRKRRSDQDDDDADDDDDDDDDEEAAAGVRPAMISHHTWSGSREEWLNAEVSPRSPAPAGFENARVLATPRPRKPASLSAVSGGSFGGLSRDSAALASLGQENVGMNDFEDATFLDRQWVLQEGMDTD